MISKILAKGWWA